MKKALGFRLKALRKGKDNFVSSFSESLQP
jgi:hypothetical protein